MVGDGSCADAIRSRYALWLSYGKLFVVYDDSGHDLGIFPTEFLVPVEWRQFRSAVCRRDANVRNSFAQTNSSCQTESRATANTDDTITPRDAGDGLVDNAWGDLKDGGV